MLGYLAVDEDMQGVPEQYRSYGSGFLGRVQGAIQHRFCM